MRIWMPIWRTAAWAIAVAVAVAGSVFWGTRSGSDPLRRLTETLSQPSPILSAETAAAASLAGLAFLGWLGWKMSATAQRLTVNHDDLCRLVLTMHEDIEALKAQVAALKGGASAAAGPAAMSEVVRHPKSPGRDGPADLADDFYGTVGAATRSQRGPASGRSERSAGRHVVTADARREERPGPTVMALGAMAQCLGDPDFKVMMDAYHGLLGGAGSLSGFEATYGPEFLDIGPGESLTPSRGDREGPFWFIAHQEHGTLGVLVPARGPILNWGEHYQFSGGARAHEVFSRAFRVEKGDVLDLVEPAWVEIIDGKVSVVKPGVLRGA